MLQQQTGGQHDQKREGEKGNYPSPTPQPDRLAISETSVKHFNGGQLSACTRHSLDKILFFYSFLFVVENESEKGFIPA